MFEHSDKCSCLLCALSINTFELLIVEANDQGDEALQISLVHFPHTNFHTTYLIFNEVYILLESTLMSNFLDFWVRKKERVS